ncbi:hypothetical protein C2S52_010819 [Perilla frutescens var. hirtella]|nr:hypothetical protein C2S52_010819 [Perilla frutescens var. hirtella]
MVPSSPNSCQLPLLSTDQFEDPIPWLQLEVFSLMLQLLLSSARLVISSIDISWAIKLPSVGHQFSHQLGHQLAIQLGLQLDFPAGSSVGLFSWFLQLGTSWPPV